MKRVITITLLIVDSLGVAKGQTTWHRFNNKNGFTIELPSYFSEGLLVAGGTMQWFKNTIGDDIELSVESFGNGTLKDLDESYGIDSETYKNITYKVKNATWYVISGLDEEGIYYCKTIIKDGKQHHLRIIYQPKNKNLLDKILGRISKSFK